MRGEIGGGVVASILLLIAGLIIGGVVRPILPDPSSTLALVFAVVLFAGSIGTICTLPFIRNHESQTGQRWHF